jgi:hypothetical protein
MDKGQRGKGIENFNSPMGDEIFTAKILIIKANQVSAVVIDYIGDVHDENPQELRTMLQYSLHHKDTYLSKNA